MSIFDRFKKNKKEPEKEKKKLKQPKEAREAKEKKAAEEEMDKKETKSLKRVEKKQFSDAYRILESPHVTEKSTILSESGSYVFKVKPQAGKREIKGAIQDLYGVAVQKVRIVNIPKKLRRLGKNLGYRPGYKKAIVKLVKGEKIEIMPR